MGVSAHSMRSVSDKVNNKKHALRRTTKKPTLLFLSDKPFNILRALFVVGRVTASPSDFAAPLALSVTIFPAGAYGAIEARPPRSTSRAWPALPDGYTPLRGCGRPDSCAVRAPRLAIAAYLAPKHEGHTYEGRRGGEGRGRRKPRGSQPDHARGF